MCTNAKPDTEEYDAIQPRTIVIPDSAQDPITGQPDPDDEDVDEENGRCCEKQSCDLTRQCQSEIATVIVCTVIVYACITHYMPKFYRWGWLRPP